MKKILFAWLVFMSSFCFSSEEALSENVLKEAATLVTVYAWQQAYKKGRDDVKNFLSVDFSTAGSLAEEITLCCVSSNSIDAFDSSMALAQARIWLQLVDKSKDQDQVAQFFRKITPKQGDFFKIDYDEK